MHNKRRDRRIPLQESKKTRHAAYSKPSQVGRKKIHGLTALAIFGALCLFSEPTWSQGYNPCVANGIAQENGACWKSLSQLERGTIVRGMWAGIHARSVGDALVNQRASYFLDRDWLVMPAQTTVGDVTRYFNSLYQIPANRPISWAWAYVLAAMNARDDDSGDGATLIKFLRQYGELPTSGRIVRVKAPDLVTIESNNRRFDVHLEGVSGKGLNREQRDRAMAFIRGLQQSTWTDCSKAEPTLFTIDYSYRMFIGETLSANLITNANLYCKGEDSVARNAIQGNAQASQMYVNGVMTSNGLVYSDSNIDPKWDRSTADFYRILHGNEGARKERLYLFGNQTKLAIDKIIDFGAQPPPAVISHSQDSSSDVPSLKSSSGSGFFIAQNMIVTADHVVSGCSRIRVREPDETSANAVLLDADKENDLALLKIASSAHAIHVGIIRYEKPLRPGDAVTVAGFPLAGLLSSSVSVTAGVVSNVAGPGDDIRLMQITAPVQPGNSGGPVLDASGNIAGVVVSKLNATKIAQQTGDIPQNVNFAVKGSILRAFLDAHQINYLVSSGSGAQAANGGTAEQITVFVECLN